LNNRSAIKLMVRTIAVLVIGIMVSVIYLSNVGSYSWFNSSAESSMRVTAAETEDIVDIMEMVSDAIDPETGAIINPTKFKVKRAEGFEGKPLIFFSVEGEAANYILHINPVRLESSGYYIIQIETDINLNQLADLLFRRNNIEGTLRVKYLNQFINEKYEFYFTPNYLMNRIMEEIDNKGAILEEDRKSIIRERAYVESPESASEDLYEQDGNEIVKEAVTSLAELAEWQGIEAGLEGGTGLALEPTQDYLMDIIFPGLKRYMEQLKDYIGELRTGLDDKTAQLANLNEELANLESQYEELMEVNDRLTEQINNLAAAKPPKTPATGGGQPSGSGGGGSGGGSSGGSVDTGSGGTGNIDTGEGGTIEGDVGEGGTGDIDEILYGTPNNGNGDTGGNDTGGNDTGEGDTGDGDTEDIDTGDGDTGSDDTGDGDTEGSDTGDTDTGGSDTGDTDTGGSDTGSGDTETDTGDADQGSDDYDDVDSEN